MKKAAIWVKKDKNGNELLNIKLSTGEILKGVFNQFKTEEKHPDFRVVDFSKTDENENFLNVGAIWKGVTKNGRDKLTIKVGDDYYTAVRREKSNENAPDFTVVYIEEETEE